LAEGGLVAIPTETVYGLAADAYNGKAVAKIFVAKGRPQDNPLIVHIEKMERLGELWTEVPERALKLAEAFWPGPLTMIMTKTDRVPEEVSCGLNTVGVRFPEHPIARKVIELADTPLAAPSANLSGKPSPTSFAHVKEDMNGRIDAILEGGDCFVGVESTVVDITGDVARILRPGAITEEMIADVLGNAFTDSAVEGGLKDGDKPRSPGMKYRHYAPESPVRLFCGSPDDTAKKIMSAPSGSALICFNEYAYGSEYNAKLSSFSKIATLGNSWDHAMHARRIFDSLRLCDGVTEIYIQCPRRMGAGAGSVNRLMRAAGFNFEKCTDFPVIGVTGRSGSGKSYIAELLGKKLGYPVFDADAVYKKLLENDSEMTCSILSNFPAADNEGKVDRRALAKIVFADSSAKAVLESITHPRIAEEARRFIAKSKGCILDVPLLHESGMGRLCTATLGVIADEKVKIERIVSRDGIDVQSAKERLAAQPGDDFYWNSCDITVKNNSDGFEKIDELAEKLIKL
jgi:L-threonylcarbamoyladenylate synthase